MAYGVLNGLPLQMEDANGNPLVGGTLEFYVWNNTTPLTAYTDSAGTALGTSCTLNSLGKPQTAGGTACQVFGSTTATTGYKVVVKDADGSVVAPTYGPLFPTLAGSSVGDSAYESTTIAGALDAHRVPSMSALVTGTWTGIDELQTLGFYDGVYKGAARFHHDGTTGGTPTTNTTAAIITAMATGRVISADGKGWVLSTQPLRASMFGVTHDGVTDDRNAVAAGITLSTNRDTILDFDRGTIIMESTSPFGVGNKLAKIRGEGQDATIFDGTSLAANVRVFEQITTSSGTAYGGALIGCQIHARSCIKINEAFTTEAEHLDQKVIMQFICDDVWFHGPDYTGILAQFHKFFNFVPTRCSWLAGDVLLFMRGSDLTTIGAGNRFERGKSANIQCEGLGSFGSQLNIKNADILAMADGAATSQTNNVKAMIVADADTIRIQECLLEQYDSLTTNMDAFISLKKRYADRINKVFVLDNNPLGVTEASKFIDLDSQDSANQVYILQESGNRTTNGPLPTSTIAGAIPYYQGTQRTLFNVGSSWSGYLPTFTERPIRDVMGGCLFTPGRPGLTGDGMGATIKIENGAWVFTPSVSAPRMTLDPKQNGIPGGLNGAANGVTLKIMAYAETAGQLLHWELSGIGNGDITLTTTPRQHNIGGSGTGSTASLDIEVLLSSDDVTGGRIFIEQVLIAQAP